MTARPVLLIIVACIHTAGGGVAQGESPRSFTDAIARSISADVRFADDRLWEIRRELAILPNLRDARQNPRYGFQSQPLFDSEEPQWLQLDLRRMFRIDGIVLVPVDLSSPAVLEDGYGFPVRFKVEVAMSEDMSDAIVVVDETGEDVPNPKRAALIFDHDPVDGRYVRITSTKHWEIMDHFIWALGEVMVVSGNYNAAPGALRQASSSVELLPGWSVLRVNDGYSLLELPVSMARSKSYGYLSEVATVPEPEIPKWVMVDLGDTYPVDEVRLIPARPRGFTASRGRGFPGRLSLELSNDPEFLEDVRRVASNRGTIPPWNNGTLMRCSRRPARYVRLVAHELEGGGSTFSFGLAELQVYSGGENIALGQTVTASDFVDAKEFPGWAPENLVDGYSSSFQLVEWPEYLASLRKRSTLQRELKGLQVRRDARAQQVAFATIAGGSALAGFSLIGLTILLVKQRSARKRDVTHLREQIARDLHDDLGSNLGSISLLSELGSRLQELPEGTRRDFQEIHDTAERSAEAMRDIVWLIDSGSTTLGELVTKMRETADRMFGEAAKVHVVPEHVPGRELSLLFRRHAFFAFKEALNNVRKHAGATEVEARIVAESGKLSFSVKDNGAGFDPQAQNGKGRGLGNLRRRAERLRGSCGIESEIGRGATVRFEVPLLIRIHGGTSGNQNPRLAGRG